MPRLRSHLSLSMYLVVAALVLIFASPLMAQPVTKTMTWNITGAQVVPTTDGSYVVQATATAQGAAHVKTGVFVVKCQIQDNGNGTFNLRGVWDITRAGAAKTTHSNPNSLRGAISVDNLGFNPAQTAGNISAQVQVNPKRRHPDKQGKATGTFLGDEKFQGVLSLTRK